MQAPHEKMVFWQTKVRNSEERARENKMKRASSVVYESHRQPSYRGAFARVGRLDTPCTLRSPAMTRGWTAWRSGQDCRITVRRKWRWQALSGR